MKHLKFLSFIGLLIATTTYFGCSNEDEEPEPQSILTADAGQDQVVDVGEEVTLDGSASEDSEGLPFDFSWSFQSTPDGSTATLDNATTATPSFTPDEPGDYVIQLTISNESSDDSDQVTVTAEENIEPVEISGSISEDSTLTDIIDDPLLPDYIAVGNLDVSAILTIDPAVIIHFDENVQLNIGSGGMLDAQGTEQDSIIMTSSNVEGGINWNGIFVESADSRNTISYTRISYAGNTEVYSGGWRSAAVAVADGGTLTITNSRFDQNENNGLFVHSNGELAGFSDNDFMNSGSYAVSLYANHVGILDGNTTYSNNGGEADVRIIASNLNLNSAQSWVALNESNYFVEGDVDISAELTIEAGAYFELGEDVQITVTGDGTMVSAGSETEPVVFTSYDEEGQIHWSGIIFESSDSRNSLEYTEILWAGGEENLYYSGWRATSVGLEDDAQLSLTNTSINNSNDYGLFVDGTAEIGAFSNNSFSNNEGLPIMMGGLHAGILDENTVFTDNWDNAVGIYRTTLSQDTSWVALNGDASYRVYADLTLEATLEIDPGAIVRFEQNIGLFVETGGGELIAIGTDASPIVFTTSNEAGEILWGGIAVESTSALNELDFVEVRYGGGEEILYNSGWRAGNVLVNGQLKVNNSTITNSGGYGVFVGSDATVNGITNDTLNDDAAAESAVNDANSISGNADQDVLFE